MIFFEFESKLNPLAVEWILDEILSKKLRPKQLNTKNLPDLEWVRLVRAKITVKLIFAAIQSLLACSAIILAGLLRFNLLDIQSSFRIADKVIILFHGDIIAEGTVDEIKNSGDARVRQFINGEPEGPIPFTRTEKDYVDEILFE